MAINFPTTTGQATDGSFKHTEVGKQWSWDGTSWNIEISHSANTLNPSPSDVTFSYATGVNINDSAAGSTPRQVTGSGTQADPYVLGAILIDARTGQTNLTGSTYEEIIIQGTAGQPVEFVAINDPDNMWDQPVGTVDANGRWKGRLFFNGNIHKNLYPNENKTYTVDIKLGSSTVYWRTNVTVVTRGSHTVTKYYDKPGVIDFTFSHHIFIPSLYACSTDQPFHGAFWDTNTYTYTRGADGYRWTTGIATFTNYNCGVPANNNCQESGGWHRLYRLEFFQMPFQYTPGTWFSNNDDPTHTVNVPTTNNAFTGTFDSGRATSTGGTMSWNPDYANLGGIKFRYNVALYDDNTGTESRAKIDGTWGSWVQHAANGWVTIGSAATAGVISNLQHIETRGIVTGVAGQQAWTSPGTYSWTAPAGVTSVCAVCVGTGGVSTPGAGGAGGAGGGLGWKNNISVIPGQSYTVVVGAHGTSTFNVQSSATDSGDSYFIDTSTVKGGGGGASTSTNTQAIGGDYVGDGGGNGGNGGASPGNNAGGGGGGAGGYSGAGGAGGSNSVGDDGNGGAGGGGGSAGSGNDASGGGGGVGLLGEGASGTGGAKIDHSSACGAGGSGGTGGTSITYPGSLSGGTANHNANECGGQHGGGAGAQGGSGTGHLGGSGAVRIIWGSGRAFPSTNTQDATVSTGTAGLPGFYAVKFDSTASSKYGSDGAIIENKDETTPLYMNGYLPYEDEGSFYPVTEWGTWSGTKCANGGWWGEAFYTCQSEVNWDTVDSVVYTEIQSFTTSIGTITPYPFGYDVIDGVKTIYASSNPTNFNFSNDGYAQPSYFTYVWSSTSTGVTFDDATKREPEVTFDANDPGLKTLTVTITSTESGITDSGASGSVEVNVLASYSNETIGTVTVSTIPISMGEDIEGSTQVKDKYMFSASYDGSTAIPKYTWTVTDTLSPVAPVIESPNAIETYITFQYDPLIVAQSGDRTVTCTITATDATDSPASDDELIYIGMS